MSIQRDFEVIDATGKVSRLTITPTRVTVKVLPNEKHLLDEYVHAAENIAESIDYPLSLRGAFSPEEKEITLATGKLRRWNKHRKGNNYFTYNFGGTLLLETIDKPVEEEHAEESL